MKISKLFHWLYATLMFLPLMFFLPSCFYYSFNKNAQVLTSQEENTTTIHMQQHILNGQPNQYTNLGMPVNWEIFDYESVEHSNEYLIINSETGCSFKVFDNATYVINDILYLRFTYYVDDITSLFISDFAGEDLHLNLVNEPLTYELRQSASYDDLSLFYGEFYTNNQYGTLYLKNVQLFNLTQMFGSGNEPTIEEFNEYFPHEYYPVDSTATYEMPNGTYTTYVDISKSIDFAWRKVWDYPCFTWTKNTFVAAPFTYITGLFGVGSDNPLNYAFAYFVSISICWLVFDLIMYVPNLAHRWLDRSALE